MQSCGLISLPHKIQTWLAEALPGQANGLAMLWAEFWGQLHIPIVHPDAARDRFFLSLTLPSRNGKGIFLDSCLHENQRQSGQAYSGCTETQHLRGLARRTATSLRPVSTTQSHLKQKVLTCCPCRKGLNAKEKCLVSSHAMASSHSQSWLWLQAATLAQQAQWGPKYKILWMLSFTTRLCRLDYHTAFLCILCLSHTEHLPPLQNTEQSFSPWTPWLSSTWPQAAPQWHSICTAHTSE